MTPEAKEGTLQDMIDHARNCAKLAARCEIERDFAAMRAWLVERDVWVARINTHMFLATTDNKQEKTQ